MLFLYDYGQDELEVGSRLKYAPAIVDLDRCWKVA